MNKYIVIGCAVWTLLTALSFAISYGSALAERERLALKIAQSSLQQILVFRKWNAVHGVVYAPVTGDFRPNPYLKDPLRDVSAGKLRLTMINPSFMTREAAEIASTSNGIKFRLTSLRVIRPGNKPTAMEKAALVDFEKGKDHVGIFLGNGDQGAYFYMEPVRTEKECLTCHSFQGYKENDIQGGISVILPFVPEIPLKTILALHAFALTLGICLISILGGKLARAYETINMQAVTDALTGIPNRMGLDKTMQTEINRCAREKSNMTVIMADIDHFKRINDTYGHATGDEYLKYAAQSINESLRRPGDFCARIGGEEFIILLPKTGLSGAMTVTERIRKLLQDRVFPIQETTTETVRMSFGITEIHDFATVTIETVLKEADEALYTAKARGRDTIAVYGKES
jgi:diguanylate cyclase (GGDEF)-like protein